MPIPNHGPGFTTLTSNTVLHGRHDLERRHSSEEDPKSSLPQISNNGRNDIHSIHIFKSYLLYLCVCIVLIWYLLLFEYNEGKQLDCLCVPQVHPLVTTRVAAALSKDDMSW